MTTVTTATAFSIERIEGEVFFLPDDIERAIADYGATIRCHTICSDHGKDLPRVDIKINGANFCPAIHQVLLTGIERVTVVLVEIEDVIFDDQLHTLTFYVVEGALTDVLELRRERYVITVNKDAPPLDFFLFTPNPLPINELHSKKQELV